MTLKTTATASSYLWRIAICCPGVLIVEQASTRGWYSSVKVQMSCWMWSLEFGNSVLYDCTFVNYIVTQFKPTRQQRRIWNLDRHQVSVNQHISSAFNLNACLSNGDPSSLQAAKGSCSSLWRLIDCQFSFSDTEKNQSHGSQWESRSSPALSA